MEPPRCPRHDVTLEPDGQCVLCQRGDAGAGGPRQLLVTLVVLAVLAVIGVAYLTGRSSPDEPVRELVAGEAAGVSITMYMADW